MAWTTLHLRVLTPIFSGDETDGPPLVRVPSVRGALRFWLRAVAAGRGLVGSADLQNLWAVEEGVLGSTAAASKIGLRIRTQPAVSEERTPDWTQNSARRSFDGAHYLLGQGLWNHRDVPARGVIRGLSRDHIPRGAEFALDVRFSGDAVPDGRFMIALWAWLTYGGLGARTRRGFGQLGCIGVDGALPAGWTAGALARPTRWESWERLEATVYPPATPWTDQSPWRDLPTGSAAALAEHPALDRRWWAGKIVGLDVPTLGDALHQAGLDWRRFRAGPDAEMDDDDLPFDGTRSPEWCGVIRGNGSSYPVGALGLPVNYFSTSGAQRYSASVTPVVGGDDLRRASPVWLRPIRLDDGQWQLFTYYFAGRLLPTGASLTLTPKGGPSKTLVPPDQAAASDAWRRWLDEEPRLPSGTDLRGR